MLSPREVGHSFMPTLAFSVFDQHILKHSKRLGSFFDNPKMAKWSRPNAREPVFLHIWPSRTNTEQECRVSSFTIHADELAPSSYRRIILANTAVLELLSLIFNICHHALEEEWCSAGCACDLPDP